MFKSAIIIDKAKATSAAFATVDDAIMVAIILMTRGVEIDSIVVTNFIHAIPVDVSRDIDDTYKRATSAMESLDSLI